LFPVSVICEPVNECDDERLGPDFAGKGEHAAMKGAAISALIGGVAAEAARGKFANGAVSAGFGYLFNELMHSGYGGGDNDRRDRAG
jgi:hypothetical protein